MSDAISLERKLRALRMGAAPAGLVGNVLVQVGLADQFSSMMTPLGPMYVAWNESGVSLLRPAKSERAFMAILHAQLGRRALAAALPDALEGALAQRFAGDQRVKIAIDLRSRSTFERSVLEWTAKIPRGTIKPYAWIALRIGNPRAVRAVGTALGKNPVPLLIPCHRVIRNDGAIGSYIFGEVNKERLLRLEGALA